MQFCCVYAITNLVNGKRYIGSASIFRNRMYSHFRELRLGNHHSPRLQNAWNKYGEDAFRVFVLSIVPNPENRLEVEQIWLDEYSPEYNIALFAHSSPMGKKWSEEDRRKISERLKGRTVSDETRKLLSEKAIGRKFTPEQASRMGMTFRINNPNKGKKLGPEHVENIKKNHWSKGPSANEVSARIWATRKQNKQ